MNRYLQSCKTEFWKNVFRTEMEYLLGELSGSKEILSVGCGPAIIEAGLAEHGFNVTGLDISREALNQAPDNVRTVVGSADKMEFADSSFDAVIYIASLQFIEKYKEAVRQSARVLRAGGKFLAMLLNPDSEFFKERTRNSDSYINKMKHTSLEEIEKTIAEYFTVQTEFFLGITGHRILRSQQRNLASVYVIKGRLSIRKRQTETVMRTERPEMVV